ncbi:hypothetical protein, conserved [Eimeria tenella]|uniref:Uncharacterized protein n=1 Tax=Eimeria tenella TaxID=5802 RepID=U6KVI0_EIMTE|nr:hypothetical protein, conserved [Eimeria tenella]CDJ42147.1 hypothetical protein, conserved [Eimeria tenella]|eukprot:XP_013232897.1 hypothetical protein, conserved [Eimeria tenella]
MDDSVPLYHLPLYGGPLQSRSNTESFSPFPRAFTCPTYSTDSQQQQQQQQLQQQQQQQLQQQQGAAAYLGYASLVNAATKSPYRGSEEEVGLLSVLCVDTPQQDPLASVSLLNSKNEKIINKTNKRRQSGARLCCGILD